MAKFGISGLDDLDRALKQLAENASSLSGEHKVDWAEIFTDDFVRMNTQFKSADTFFEMLPVKSQEDLELIEDSELDSFAKSCSKFETFEDMIGTAAQEFVQRQLMDGF